MQSYVKVMLGIFFTAVFFILSVIIVLGIKSLIVSLVKKKKYSSPRRRKRKAIRSVEINPDEIDRIYVKKVS